MGFWEFLAGSSPGGAAGEVVQKAIVGFGDLATKLIEEWHLPPEKEAQIKLALLQHQVQATQQVLDDIQSARAMQMQTKSFWPGIISTIEVIGFFGGLFFIIWYGFPKDMDEFTKAVLNMLFGAVVTGYASVRNFWLGSSAGSQSKDQLIYNSTPAKKE